MTSSEIRNSFLKFFEERGHTLVPSSPVIPFDDPTLLFTNAGMNQFKDVFLGTGSRTYKRAANTQKCIRVSGKHNDLEEVGHDTYHHTFFEMLGNWSFGDYYKTEAIQWAWELLTKVWNLPKNRLWATVYKDDTEAEEIWKSVTDIDKNHILRFGEKDNFWEMGETGPCGPCSEIHIDRTPKGNATAEMVNAGTADVIEIWNLVFIQYNRDDSGKLTPLPAKHVDTGMGFERICAVLQDKNSNYDTDVFIPIINKISEITKKPYNINSQSAFDDQQSKIDIAMRVIADHVRTLTFAIGDGAIPSNEGRGYVLRRILRRACRYGRNLDVHEPFIYMLVPVLVETMSYIFTEIKNNQEHIQKIIKGEEEAFNATLDRGIEKFEEIVKKIGTSKIFPGDDAFKLYDTYGFPLDLTELMALERGLKVDVARFNILMEEQRDRSREGGKDISAKAPSMELQNIIKNNPPTEFKGYETLECEAEVISAINNYMILDKSPFYAESGGQIGDTGIIKTNSKQVNVTNTIKMHQTIVHELSEPVILPSGSSVIAKVDIPRRLSIMRNHSATHLLHNSLRRILGKHVQQAGSLVAPEYFRFDFTHSGKLTDKELADIEALVNEKIKENIPRTPNLNNIPFEEAKKMGALMFFGEKYGERVNVIQFGDFSTEFCGGTHVNNTGEIGYFKITSEESIASGVRRIEGVTHEYALKYLKSQYESYLARLNECQNLIDNIIHMEKELHNLGKQNQMGLTDSQKNIDKEFTDLKRPIEIPAIYSQELKSYFDELESRNLSVNKLIETLTEQKKSCEKELNRLRLKSMSASIDSLVSSALSIGSFKLVATKISASSIEEMKSISDTLRSKLGSGIGLLASVIEDKVQLVCVVTDDLIKAKKADASKIIREVAKLVGGNGGGRPHMATAGGKEIEKLDEAINKTKYIVETLLK